MTHLSEGASEFVHSDFTPEEVQAFRDYINSSTGGHNFAPEAHRLPQDVLVKRRTIIVGNCGVTYQYFWASGRVDAKVGMADIDDAALKLREFQDPEGTKLILENYKKTIQKLKERTSNGERTENKPH